MWGMPLPSSGLGTHSRLGFSWLLGNGVPAWLNAEWRCGIPGLPAELLGEAVVLLTKAGAPWEWRLMRGPYLTCPLVRETDGKSQ